MHQVDLEELIEKCYGARAKTYLREAIDCYKVSAYRACVISTWIAVVFDIIDKLRELSLAGDNEAKEKVRKFDEINEHRKIEEALEFERSILGIAQDPFEFITAQEVIDLSRLQEDRNRCAHPNLVREDDIYKPTPEMTRAHLRNAVDILLKRPPVQGKAALSYLQSEVDSQYFPTSLDAAYEALKASPIVRAKRGLIKDFLFGAIVSCIKEPLADHKIYQRMAAVSAVCRIHPYLSEDLLKHGIDNVYSHLQDNLYGKAVFVLYQLPLLVPWLSRSTQQKFNSYVGAMPVSEVSTVLCYALHIDAFIENALARVQSLSETELWGLIKTHTLIGLLIHRVIVNQAIKLYEESINFDVANTLADTVVRPLIKLCDKDQVKRIVNACTNSQVRGSYNFTVVLQELKSCEKLPPVEFDQLLHQHGLDTAVPHLMSTWSPPADDEVFE